MRISLVTRVSATYLLLLVLLGSVVVYSVWSMEQMKREVVLLKQGVLPTSNRLQRFNQEVSKAYVTLKDGNSQELLWLAHYLPEMQPLERLESLGIAFRAVAQEPHLEESLKTTFRQLALRIDDIVHGGTLLEFLERKHIDVPVDWKGMDNLQAYREASKLFLAQNRASFAPGKSWRDNTARRILQGVMEKLRREVTGLEATYNLAANAGLGTATEKQEQTVRVALYMVGAALVLIVVVFLLLMRWLRPIPKLGRYAQQISMGEYDHPLPRTTSDEIGVLAQELHRMAQRLKEREEMIKSQARELVRADRFSTIGKMSTQIAHEVRNPLNAMGLKLELLEESVDETRNSLSDESYRELTDSLQAVMKEIDRLREITDYYLKFAKFPKVEKEMVDLQMVLIDIAGFYSEEARRKGVSIETDVEAGLRLRADSNLIRHAVANLLKNAIEALRQHDVENRQIFLKAWRSPDRIHVSVKDNGPGLDSGEAERVFEPFYTTKKSGTGLGLTLVQQIIQEHGGELRCSGRRDEGATFSFTLPL